MGLPVSLGGLTVAVLGGDRRESLLVDALANSGAHVVAVGYVDLPTHRNIRSSRSLVEAVSGADAVIAPMSNTDAKGNIRAVQDPTIQLRLDESFFRSMRPGVPFFIGIAQPLIRLLAQQHGVHLIESAEVDEIATLNSIPTAEGAIQRAMEELPITIHGSYAAVVGFGRCGITLARMLHALGARTRVVARSPYQLARAFEMGLTTFTWRELPAALEACDVIFNTVPVRVLDRSILQTLPKDCLIIDIASAPGGTDFSAAETLGIRAFLELGLPGRVAPQTAGEILARCIPPMIRELCT